MAAESASCCEKRSTNPQRIGFVAERSIRYITPAEFPPGEYRELFALREELEHKIRHIASFDGEIEATARRVEELAQRVRAAAEELRIRRREAAEPIAASVTEVLRKLGMAHATFEVRLESLEQPGARGMDDVQFLFSSGRNAAPQDIARIASGGEISRVMLALKTLITDSIHCPLLFLMRCTVFPESRLRWFHPERDCLAYCRTSILHTCHRLQERCNIILKCLSTKPNREP